MALLPVTLHAISPDNVVFVYNTNVSGSFQVAEYYRNARGLPLANLIGLSMPVPVPSNDCETPISKSDFEQTILEPLRSAISALQDSAYSGSSEELECSAIVLGYGTPLSYQEDDGEVISIASRLHRIDHGYEAAKANHTFDRRTFQFYDAVDAQEVIIVSAIDGPTAEAAMKLIDRAVAVTNSVSVTGKIFVDPYGRKSTTADAEYQADILDFVNNESSNLGLNVSLTVDVMSDDPYEEPTFASLEDDSFYWGWYEPAYSKNLFVDHSFKRVFLYNADDEAGCSIHYLDGANWYSPNGSDPWCNLAINVDPGYAACAGAVDAPGSENHLRPRAFFRALHQGASLGEAFLFASPVVNWKVYLIGDPLMTVNFPEDVPTDQQLANTVIPNKEAIFLMKEAIEEGLAWGVRQSKITKRLRQDNVTSHNIAEEIELLYALAKWENLKKEDAQNNLYYTSTNAMLTYILDSTGLTFSDWLSQEGHKTTELLNNLLLHFGTGAIAAEDTENLLHPEGHWEYDFVYTHVPLTFVNVHFRIQVSETTSFSNIVVDRSSIIDIEGWKYEQESYAFVQMPSTGFPSNFSGRRVRFVSPEEDYLTRTDAYYVRWRALNSDGSPLTNWQPGSKVLIIKR